MILFEDGKEFSVWMAFKTENPDLLMKYKDFFGWKWLNMDSYDTFFYRRGTYARYSEAWKKELTYDMPFSRDEIGTEMERFRAFGAEHENSVKGTPEKWEPVPDDIFGMLDGSPECIRNAFIYGHPDGRKADDICLFLKMRDRETGEDSAKRFSELFMNGRKPALDGTYHCFGCKRFNRCGQRTDSTLNFGIELERTRNLPSRNGYKRYQLWMRSPDSNMYSEVEIGSDALRSPQTFRNAVMKYSHNQGHPISPIISQSKRSIGSFHRIVEAIQRNAVKEAESSGKFPLRFVKSVFLAVSDRKIADAFKPVCEDFGVEFETMPCFSDSSREDDWELIIVDDEEKDFSVKDKSKVCYYKTKHLHERYLTTLSMENIMRCLFTVNTECNDKLAELIRDNGFRKVYQRKDCSMDFGNRVYMKGDRRTYLTNSQECDLYVAVSKNLNKVSMAPPMRANIDRAGLLDLF